MAFYHKDNGRTYLVRFVCRYQGLDTYAVEREYSSARIVLNATDVERIDSSQLIPDDVAVRAVRAFLANERAEFVQWCGKQSPKVDPMDYPAHPLAAPDVGNHGAQPNYAAEEIVSILRAADVEQWNQLPGKAIRVKRRDGMIVAIGHITKNDRWYEPEKAFSNFPRAS